MPLRPAQLDAALDAPLKSTWLVSGDEPLQQMEVADRILATAREQGYTERQIFTVETGFDWSLVAGEAAATSLFAERRIIDLRLGTRKPGKAGGAVLTAFLENPPPDTLLLISAARLERSVSQSAWVKRLEQMGSWVAVWPLSSRELRGWLVQRLKLQGFTAEEAAINLLLDRVQGNLLAAAQEIAKLALLYPPGPLDTAQMMEAVTGSARYDINDLTGALRTGDARQVSRILEGLRDEGVEPTLVAWALVREARILSRIASGGKADALWKGLSPQQRQGLEQAARRWRGSSARLLVLLAARADRVVKGQAAGDVWDELLQLALVLGGRALFPPAWSLAAETGRVLA